MNAVNAATFPVKRHLRRTFLRLNAINAAPIPVKRCLLRYFLGWRRLTPMLFPIKWRESRLLSVKRS